MMAVEDFESFKSDKFMEIVDVGLFEGYYTEFGKVQGMNGGLVLPIIQSNGVEITPNFSIKTTDLQNGYKNFKSNNDDTITFKVDVIIKYNATWGYGHAGKDYAPWKFDGKAFYSQRWYVIKWLDYWMRNMRPLYVVSDAIDVPNGTYLLTKNSKRKQTYRNFTIWTLEFTTFKELNIYRYYNDNSLVQAAIDALKPKTTTTTSKSSSTQAKTLANCTPYTEIKYSSTKLVTECNKLMQQKLAQLGYLSWDNVDGWYGPVTANAVKAFQRAWNSRGGSLAVDGDCGPVTLNRLLQW